MKEIVCDMEDVKYVLKQILLTLAGVHLAKLKDQMLRFLRHQIMIWIEMKEKQNMRIMIMSCVKNVIKKLINSIIIVQFVLIRKLIEMKEIVCDMEDVKYVLKQMLTLVVHLAKLKDQMLRFLRHQIMIWIGMKEKQNMR